MDRYIQTDLSGNTKCMVQGTGLLGGTIESYMETAMGSYTNPSHVTVSGSPLSVDARPTLSFVNDDLDTTGSPSGQLQFTANSTNLAAPGPWIILDIVGKSLTETITHTLQLAGGTIQFGVDWGGSGGGAGEVGQITLRGSSGTPHKPCRHRFLTT